MKSVKYFTCFLFILQFQSAGSQVFLSEGFESGTRPEGWTQEYVHPPVHTEPWRYRNGGHSPNDNNWLVPADEEDITRNPPSAYEGTYNAVFFKQGDNNEKTKLITPSLDLEGGAKVELSFYLSQVPWTFDGVTSWDVLRVYYKTAEGSPWILLREYLDPVYDWELQTVVLPELSSDYFVAFEGHTRWGYGTCIDNIVIEEKGEQQLWVSELEFSQPFEPAIPAGSVDVPLMRIDVRILGNTGSAILDHINFNSLNSSDSDIKPGSVKLYRTPNQTFNTSEQIGAATGFLSGTASFSALEYSLPQGRSYLWLTVDTEPGAPHGNILDVMVPADGIMIGDTLYPATDQSPPGERIIYETVYFQDFEGAHGWELSGEFEVDAPNGMGGSPGNPNPAAAFSGSRVLGTDLTGLGAHPYNYEPNLTVETAYRATSPEIDAFYYRDLSIFFQRHLNIEVWDEAAVQLSRDNGVTWETVWLNNGFISDFEWAQVNKLLPEEFWRTEDLKIRFQLGPTDNQNNYSGWNIDDVFITGEFISRDAGVTEWVSPRSGCGHTADEQVTVRIGNFGGADITEPFPVGYSLDGGATWTTDICSEVIPVGGSVLFTFPTGTDLTEPGLRAEVHAKTMLDGDQWPDNDQISTQLQVLPTILPPYSEGFEAGDGYWYTAPGSIWEYGTPAGTVINSSDSGEKGWVTGLTRKYGDMISQYGQTIFNDNFQTESQWTFTGEFERDIPVDLPWFAWSGLYCAGTDLSGQGDLPYMYEKGITPHAAHSAITPAIDVSAFNNLTVSFFRWLSINEGDSVSLEVSPDNGITWHPLWKNTEGEIRDEYWENKEYDIHDSLSYATQLKIKFSLFYSAAEGDPAHGLNIDDVTVYGDLVNNVPFALKSPCFDLSGMTHPVFEASLWIDTEQGVDGAALFYSLDGGTSWNKISNTSGFDDYWNWYTGQAVSALDGDGWSGQSGGWIRVRHLLPPEIAGNESVKFILTFIADDVNNNFDGIALDKVKIYQAPHDAGVTGILSPVSGCDLTLDEKFTLRVKNFGITDMEEGEKLNIGYHINRNGALQNAEEAFILDRSFPAGSTIDIEMKTGFDFSLGGEYQAVVFTIEKEPLFYNPEANDLYSLTILVEKPVFSMGPDIYTARPDTVVLAPYAGEGIFQYLWQDNSTDPVFPVQEEGTYSVKVTNHIGCFETDEINIYLLIADVGISEIISPVSSCEAASDTPITVSIENYGTDTLRINDTIFVYGELNQSVYFHDTLVLREKFYPSTSIDFTFSSLFDFSPPGIYNLELYTSLRDDFNASNDTVNTEIHVYGFPEVDLGPDREIYALDYVLDAGDGFTEYLWQDGSAGQQYLVDRPGQEMYSVRVTDINGCTGSDSAFITLNVMDIAVDQILSPATTACILSANQEVSARIRNTGNLPVQSGDMIGVGYSVDYGSAVLEEIILEEDLMPGSIIDHVFSEPARVEDGSTYHFSVFIDMPGDMNGSNDTIAGNVDVFATRRVDLGDDYQVVSALAHVLDAGNGFASYLWHDGTTEQTFTVNSAGIHTCSITVTDNNGCADHDQVQILLLVPDIGVTDIIQPQTACMSDKGQKIEIEIKNHGNSNISTTTDIKAAYSVNGSDPVVEDVILTTTFGAGQTISHTFAQTFEFAGPDDYNITAYTIYAADLYPGNDSMTKNIEILERPVVDIGNGHDTLLINGSTILTAPSGYESYIWQDESTGSTFIIEDPVIDWFHVTVTGFNSCQATDSVYVMFRETDLELVSVNGPSSDCKSAAPEQISVEIGNAGIHAIPAGEVMHLNYKINQGPGIRELLKLTEEMAPEDVISFTFKTRAALEKPGTYDILVWFDYEPDMNSQNNSALHTTIIHGFPEVDLAQGDTLYTSLPVTLEAGEGYDSYLWNDGSDQETLAVTKPGMYRVTVVDRYGCAGTDSVVIELPVGIDALRENVEVMIYPNPVSDVLNIIVRSDRVHDRLGVELINLQGITMYRNETSRSVRLEEKLDIKNLPKGLYIMKISVDNSYSTRTIVIN